MNEYENSVSLDGAPRKQQWTLPATRITVPSTSSIHTQRTNSSQMSESRTAHFNHLGGANWNNSRPNTVAPMKRGPIQPVGESLQKRPRHTDPDSGNDKFLPFEKGDVIYSKDQRTYPWKGHPHSTRRTPLRETSDRSLERRLAGDNSSSESDDPLNISDDTAPRSENDSRIRISATPLAKDLSLLKEPSETYENNTNALPNHGLPSMDMYKVKNSIAKPSRIASMKDQSGRTRNDANSSLAPNFGGSKDPLSQSSLRGERKSKQTVYEPSQEIIPIKYAYFGKTPVTGPNIGTMTFVDDLSGGACLKLERNDQVYLIHRKDLHWVTYDKELLFLCFPKEGSKVYRELQAHGIMPEGTLGGEFPQRTMSLQFEQHSLSGPTVIKALEATIPEKRTQAYRSTRRNWELLRAAADSKIASVSSRLQGDVSVWRGKEKRPITPELSSGSNTPSRDEIPSPRRETRATTRHKKTPELDPEEIILVYPFSGPGGIQITRGDQQRLLPGEFLNDTLIEFGLRYWLDTVKKVNPQLAEQIHIFSPFFYKKLKNKDLDMGYEAVRKWTSKVDIFQKRYLVVPINERNHWYFAIILYPEHVLRPSFSMQVDTPIRTRAQRQEQISTTVENLTVDAQMEVHQPNNDQKTSLTTEEDSQMKDQLAQESNGDSKVAFTRLSYSTPSSPGVPSEELLRSDQESSPSLPDESWKAFQDSTWLLTFDSLGGSHPAVFRTLKSYLSKEAKHKKDIDVGDGSDIMQKKVPSPAQPNYCDCGIYVIKTVETYLERPDDFFQRLMDKENKLTETHPLWEVDAFPFKRDELQSLISMLSTDWLEQKTAKQGQQISPSQPSQSSEIILVQPESVAPQEQDKNISDDDDDIQILGENKARKGRGRKSKYP
ncbi:cysteine proteinase [Serendipita vermifera]|nr:cysteine proteinase [Serendipita vermifera]